MSRGRNTLAMASSSDNGMTYGGLHRIPGLVQPGCGLGLLVRDDVIHISYDDNGTLGSAAPSAHDNSRNNLTVAHSSDFGATWVKRHVDRRFTGLSAMAVVESGREQQLGLLYEGGRKRFDGDGIWFAVLPFPPTAGLKTEDDETPPCSWGGFPCRPDPTVLAKPAGWNCTCSAQEFCKPLTGHGPVTEREVLATWGTVPQIYRPLSDIDWNVTTTLVLGAWPGSSIWQHESPNATELICTAHSYGVRVVLAGPFHLWWPGAVASKFTKPDRINASTQAAMAEAALEIVYANGFDGINFDLEGGYTAAYEPDVTGLVRAVSSSFKAALPNAQISFWLGLAVAQRPLGFNINDLAQAVDLVAVMGYDLISNQTTVAGPSLRMSFFEESVEQLIAGGVPADKIVAGFGWRATEYACTERNQTTERCTCATTEVYAGRKVCSPKRYGYFAGLQQLETSAQPRGKLRWSSTEQASYFNTVAPTSASGSGAPTVSQWWVDGPETLAPRYEWARLRRLRGVTMWTTSGACCWPPYVKAEPAAEEAMWKTISEHFLGRSGG